MKGDFDQYQCDDDCVGCEMCRCGSFTPNTEDSWKDVYGTFTPQGQYKTVRQLESEGWKFDFDGTELKRAMSPDDLKKSIKDKHKSNKKKVKKSV
jgi:hypothetical protein